MKKEDLFESIGAADNELLSRSERKIKNNRLWLKWGAAAACIALAAVIGITIWNSQTGKINLSGASHNVSVKYINKAPDKSISPDLESLTEEELFTKFNTDIFRGTVTKISNVVINYNGDKEYHAIAEVQIEKVFRGNCTENEMVTVLLPCPIDADIWVEDTETVSAMKEGTHGIFMVTLYSETSFMERNGAKLMLRDIADYGFPDGSRYAFLQTENGLRFSKYAYKSIANARSLDQIEEYIVNMLKNK